MGIGLVELSNEYIQEFDQRQKELGGIIKETVTELRKQKEESKRQFAADQADRSEKRAQLRQKTRELLQNYHEESVRLKQSLNNEQSAESQELLTWIKDGKNQIRAWGNALHYTQRKRGRR